MQRLRVIYRGNVQGVGFRWTCSSIASSHAVTGWVRNEPDTSVLLETQGEPRPLAEFLADIDHRLSEHIREKSSEPIPIIAHEASFRIER